MIFQVVGVKGVFFLVVLKGFDFVKGVVIDYMYNVLIGVVKVFQDKWFYGDKYFFYYIGKKVYLYILLCNDLDLVYFFCSFVILN